MPHAAVRLRLFVSMLVLIILAGTLGLMHLERFSFIDSLYFTIATITTVGYGDIHPLTPLGKILTVILILTGVGVFLGVVANATEWLFSRRSQEEQRAKMHTVISIFYRELGDQLLGLFSQADPQLADLRTLLRVDQFWEPKTFSKARTALARFAFKPNPDGLDWNRLRALLKQQHDLLLRLLENPSLLEQEHAAELLRAVFHLADELLHRRQFKSMPAADKEHLAGDARRAYMLLATEWLGYLQDLKKNYPYLFSLAIRLNPLDPEASALVPDPAEDLRV